jgi:hypothetical protein
MKYYGGVTLELISVTENVLYHYSAILQAKSTIEETIDGSLNLKGKSFDWYDQ